MIKKALVFFAVIVSVANASSVINEKAKETKTGDANKAKDTVFKMAGDKAIERLNNVPNALNIKKARGQFSVDNNGGWYWNIGAVSALKETKKDIVLVQYQYNKQKKHSTLNAGLVFRTLYSNAGLSEFLSTDSIILGVNAFYDVKSAKNIFKINNNHRRYSLGVELKAPKLDIYANTYKGLSGVIGGYKVMNGYDFGITGKLPKLHENFKTEDFYVGVKRYAFKGETVKKGNEISVEYRPNSVYGVKLTHDIKNNQRNSTSILASINFKIGVPLEDQLSKPAFSSDVWEKRYDFVERENTVILEKAKILNGLVLSVSKLQVKEGTSKTFTAKLKSKVATGKTVVLDVTSSKTAKATVSPARLTFTSTNWNTAQTVTVTGVQDADTSDESLDIIFKANASSTGNVAGLSETKLKTTVRDDDTSDTLAVANITKTYSDGLTISKSDIENVLTVSGGQTEKSDWTLVSLADTDSSVAVTVSGTTLQVSQGITAGTTITATFRHADYADKTATFELIVPLASGDAISSAAPSATTEWGTPQTITRDANNNTGGYGALSYAITGGTARAGANVDGSTRVVTAVREGTVIVKVSRAAGTKYAAATKDITLTFTRQAGDAISSAAPSPATAWGTDQTVPKDNKDAPNNGYGDYTYAINGGTAPGASISGRDVSVTGPGSVVIRVSRVDGIQYAAATKDITLNFNHKTGTAISSVAPTQTAWGTPQTVLKDTNDGKPGYGAYTYALKPSGTNTAGASINNRVVTATREGTVVIRVSRVAGDKYDAATRDITLTFTRQAGARISSAAPTPTAWGSPQTVPKDTNDGVAGYGAYTYAITGGTARTGATIVGRVVNATREGTVFVTVSRVDGTKYAAKSKEAIRLRFTLQAGDAISSSAPAATAWGTPQIVPKDTNDGAAGYGKYTYEIVPGGSNTANARMNAGTGAVTASNAGSVVVRVSRTAGTKYDAKTKDITLNFN